MNLAASSGLDATPVSFRPSQRPQVSSPGSLVVHCFRFRCHRLSTVFRRFPPAAFTSRLRPLLPGLRHCFLFTLAAVVRPHHPVRMLPLSRSGRVRAPWSSAQVPRFSPKFCRHSSGRLPISVVSLSTSRFSGPTQAVSRFSCCVTRHMLRSAYYPCFCSSAALPDTLPSVRPPAYSRRARVFESLEGDSVLSRAPAPCRAFYGLSQP